MTVGKDAQSRGEIVAGHIDRRSGEPCGWANGSMSCSVPGCKFSDERCVLVQRQRMERASCDWLVWDFTTGNLLGEFDTEAEALAHIEDIRPFGRYGPDGHDLQAVRADG